jgi:hypothetical protein
MVIFLGDGFNLSVLPTLLGAFHGNFHGRFIGIVHGKKWDNLIRKFMGFPMGNMA